MDLDDGVLVNYLRMGKALRSILYREEAQRRLHLDLARPSAGQGVVVSLCGLRQM